MNLPAPSITLIRPARPLAFVIVFWIVAVIVEWTIGTSPFGLATGQIIGLWFVSYGRRL